MKEGHKEQLMMCNSSINNVIIAKVFSNYDFHSSVTSILKDLDWPTLEERQKASKSTLLSKTAHQQISYNIAKIHYCDMIAHSHLKILLHSTRLFLVRLYFVVHITSHQLWLLLKVGFH